MWFAVASTLPPRSAGQVVGSFGLVPLGMVGVGIAAGDRIPAAGRIGGYSLIAMRPYLVTMRVIFLRAWKRIETVEEVRKLSSGVTPSRPWS